ncbi:MAG TPA: GH1 family beta-glucosidase [Candidatus Dormibacteraeota bacterium]|nr:GH1 family beta-glucosidase [Candidatus Dormibacteraeota bacterium]
MRTSDTELDPAALAARFPSGFQWGFAASAYQIEGAAAEDGRGPSIWDTFSRVPGAIADGTSGGIACDHYHRFPEDIALMAGIGARTYRLGVSWPRVQPDGTGAANQQGLDFYDRLVDGLLAAGIRPLVNLFHWDLPQALQDRGGFADAPIVQSFAEYAALVAARLGDRVTDWMTFNEPAVFAFLGHADGIHAPGLHDWPTAIRVADNELRAHAAGAGAIRAHVRTARIGLAFDMNQVVPATDSERDRRAAAQWRAARDAWFLDPLFGRGYPQLGLEAHRAAGHLEGVELTDPPPGNLDYLGLNYYRRDPVAARSDAPFDWTIDARPGTEQTQMGWEVAPDGLRDVLLALHREYAPREIVITENGAAYPDTLDSDGRVRDDDRIAYLARHVAAAGEAVAAGVPLTGYHVWSLLDNYEWSLGYTRRFGLVRVDFERQRRTLKDSARWYQRLIAATT